MVKITYYGQNAFVLSDGKVSLGIDPFITGNPNADVDPKNIKIDYLLITHGHPDHLGDGIEIAKNCDATIIAPFELAIYCEKKGCKVHPMHIGGGFDFPFGRVKLTIAHHGSAIVDGDDLIYAGNPCGFLVGIGGKTIYHAGDTGLFYDMKLIGETNKIDIALLPIGDNFTMGVDDAVRAVEMLNPELVIPMHYDTFDIIKADTGDFIQKVEKLGKKARTIGFGETIEIV